VARPVRSRAELAAARASAAGQAEQLLAAATSALEPGAQDPTTKGANS